MSSPSPPPPSPPSFPPFKISIIHAVFQPRLTLAGHCAMDCTVRTCMGSPQCQVCGVHQLSNHMLCTLIIIIFPDYWTVFWLRLHLLAYPFLPLENFWLQHTLMTWVCFCDEFNPSSPPIHTFSMYLFLPTLQEQPDHVLTSVSQTTPILISTICGGPIIHTTSR